VPTVGDGVMDDGGIAIEQNNNAKNSDLHVVMPVVSQSRETGVES